METAQTPTILLSERDAAVALGLAPRTLTEWRRRGEGPPHVRISSRCIRYRVRDLEQWAEERLCEGTSDGNSERPTVGGDGDGDETT